MDDMLNQAPDNNPFTGKVRVRVCGILKEDDRILLLRHNNIGPQGYLWSPPGGGVEFGDTLEDTLVREFKEETDLHIKVDDYLFSNEFIDKQYHAIELFFSVTRLSGSIKLGTDPELSKNEQILSDCKFFSKLELNELTDGTIHNAFTTVNARDKITELRGLITFKD